MQLVRTIPSAMELLQRAKCAVCEKIFCCPDHRRKHERSLHGVTRKQNFRLKPLLQAESYALEIRKSFLYLESKKINRHELSRKRRYSTLATRTVQITSTTIDMGKRKIVTPTRKTKVKALENTDCPSTSNDHCGPFSNKSELTEDIISPVEPDGKASNKLLTGKAPLNQNGDNESAVFTSTPIQKKVRISSSVPKEDIPTKSEWLSRRRKVRFEGSEDSLYLTADEGKSPRSGILSSVATAIQTAFHTLPGSRVQKKNEEEVHPEPLRFPPIHGRRPLRPTVSDSTNNLS